MGDRELMERMLGDLEPHMADVTAWSDGARQFVDDMRQRLAGRTFEPSHGQVRYLARLHTKFSDEPEGLRWLYYNQGEGS